MRLTGIGSQYLMAVRDADGNRLDGSQTYRVTLPPDIPAARFWSITALRQRDALDAPDAAALPARGEPVLSDAGGDRERRRLDDHHVRPGRPDDTPEGNWIQTTEGKGWFTLLRLYSPLEPFFDKSWRPSEIELVS